MSGWVTRVPGSGGRELLRASFLRTWSGGRGRPGAAFACLLLGLVLLVGCSDLGARAGTPPRHLVLVTVDTLRADHLSAWRYPRATSDLAGVLDATGSHSPTRPSLDRLAAEGVVFANAFAPRGMTSPSVATIMTSRTPLEHGLVDNEDTLCAEVPTLAETLQRAGFATAAFTTNLLLAPPSGFERGFDHFENTNHGAESDKDLLAVRAATLWLIEQDLENGPPIFLWLHLMGPHLPYDPWPLEGVDYRTLFTDPDYAGAVDGGRDSLDGAHTAGRRLSFADVDQAIALYDGEIARIDHLLSLFFEVLSGAGAEQPVDVLSDSIVAVTSDHGEELYERNGYFGHSKSVYASVLHVPLILRHPNSLLGRRVMERDVELADLMPTFLEWLEVDAPPGLDGRSLLSLVDRRGFADRDLFATWKDRIFTVRSGSWRLVWNPDGVEPDNTPPGSYPIPEVALFDLARDPRELVDVSNEHPEVVRDLKTRIEAWRARLDPICTPAGGASTEALHAGGYMGDDP